MNLWLAIISFDDLWLVYKNRWWIYGAKATLVLLGVAVLGLCAVYGWWGYQRHIRAHNAACLDAFFAAEGQATFKRLGCQQPSLSTVAAEEQRRRTQCRNELPIKDRILLFTPCEYLASNSEAEKLWKQLHAQADRDCQARLGPAWHPSDVDFQTPHGTECQNFIME